jgi:hypothetical protein
MDTTTGGTRRLPDVYFSQDYPILLAIARAELDAQAQALPPQPEQLAEALGRPLVDICASVARLRDAGFLEGTGVMRGIKDYLLITRITTEGLREVGAYPKTTDLADRLQRFLDAEAEAVERTDPERGRKIRRAAQTLTEVGTTFAAKFAAEMVKPG